MMQQITYITVDVGRVDSLPPIVPAKQGDSGRVIHVTVTDKGMPVSITGVVPIFKLHKPDNTNCLYDEGILISGNTVIIPLVAQTLTAAGRAVGEISLYASNAEVVTTFAFWIDIEKSAVSDGEIVSTDYYNALTQVAAQILATSTMVKPLGFKESYQQLLSSVYNPSIGDIYGVGTTAPYDFYIWNGSKWVNGGPLQGMPGKPGVTFTPYVSSDGVLSWSNDGGLENPAPTNITGPMGLPGTGLKILGYYATLDALMSDVTTPSAGDTYGVGISAPYNIYVWDSISQAWINNGQIEGSPGEEGKPGATFTPYVSSDGVISWSNDGGLVNPPSVNIKGAPGRDGSEGPQGPAGPNEVTQLTSTDIDGVLLGNGQRIRGTGSLSIQYGGTGATSGPQALINLGAKSRNNYVKNWDFLNPVNQRGKTSWSGTDAYQMDCWKFSNTYGTASLDANGLHLSSSGGVCYFLQWLEEDITGADIVLSCVEDGLVQSAFGKAVRTSGVVASVMLNSGVSLQLRYESSGLYRIVFSIPNGASTTITKVKLEPSLGDDSIILCTLETDSKSDYIEELLRCQRYFHLYPTTAARPSSGQLAYPPMRLQQPNQGEIQIGGVTYYYNSAEI